LGIIKENLFRKKKNLKDEKVEQGERKEHSKRKKQEGPMPIEKTRKESSGTKV